MISGYGPPTTSEEAPVNCEHENLTVTAVPYCLRDDDGDLVARTVHVIVRCTICGCPFRFQGPFLPPPTDPVSLMAHRGAWATADGSEMAAKLEPMPWQAVADPLQGLMSAVPAGRA